MFFVHANSGQLFWIIDYQSLTHDQARLAVDRAADEVGWSEQSIVTHTVSTRHFLRRRDGFSFRVSYFDYSAKAPWETLYTLFKRLQEDTYREDCGLRGLQYLIDTLLLQQGSLRRHDGGIKRTAKIDLIVFLRRYPSFARASAPIIDRYLIASKDITDEILRLTRQFDNSKDQQERASLQKHRKLLYVQLKKMALKTLLDGLEPTARETITQLDYEHAEQQARQAGQEATAEFIRTQEQLVAGQRDRLIAERVENLCQQADAFSV